MARKCIQPTAREKLKALSLTTQKELNLSNKKYFQIKKNENTVCQNLWDIIEQCLEENV